jgi:NAD-dependent deacetylase
VRHVITQNIDGLHQASGIPPDRIIELHGNATYAACVECRMRFELEPIKQAFAADGTLPVCGCGGPVKTATVSFGQPMPQDEMVRANAVATDCDLFIVVGSSLVVYPAAGFPLVAKNAGARLVILNRDPTELDQFADLVINAEIGATMAKVVPLD